MSNLTAFGATNYSLYLQHYYEGKLSFNECKFYLGCCFYDLAELAQRSLLNK